ncbi:hypothetical protein BaRGS_00009913 [Batillaria attramentaria]|uniref:Uncharacterized protein n=1 Tax=Batillaria attramentaria TaxID=370345 RepID=A0ABD0LH50_9CAEN
MPLTHYYQEETLTIPTSNDRFPLVSPAVLHYDGIQFQQLLSDIADRPSKALGNVLRRGSHDLNLPHAEAVVGQVKVDGAVLAACRSAAWW